MKITLYHGSTLSIEHPLAKVGRADLDFGRGFYLTSLRSQADSGLPAYNYYGQVLLHGLMYTNLIWMQL